MTEDTTSKKNSAGKASPPALTIDWELYGKYLDESDLSDAEKREFLETLWSIVVSFVDLGFGVQPLQQVTGNACEQQAEIASLLLLNLILWYHWQIPPHPNSTHPLIGNPANRRQGVQNETKPKRT